MILKKASILPGFGMTLGLTLSYLTLIVLIPLTGLFLNTLELTSQDFLKTVTSPRVLASFGLSFKTAVIAALVNTILGSLIAWILARYSFSGKRIIDAMIDLPFALPTAVAGIVLTSMFSRNGYFGKHLESIGIQVAFTPLGIVIALIFISLPFVVRTIQPVLEESEIEIEEAALSLGANRWQVFTKIIFPGLVPALLTGFALSFARAVGEYGSVVFISGNMPFRTEIIPLLIITKLEQHDYAGATAISSVMLLFSFIILLFINFLQYWKKPIK